MPDNNKIDILFFIYVALEFMDAAISGGGSVLVHCMRGCSRAPSIACAYLMWKEGLTLQDFLTKNRHLDLSPNFNFMCQLRRFAASHG
jgi:dual specificity phosphatase 12